MSDVMTQYWQALDGLDAIVRAAPADRWEAPSPCEEWRAIDVLGHLIWDQQMIQAWAADAQPAPQPSPPGVLAGADPVAAWAAARDATLVVLTPAALDHIVNTRYLGRVPLAELVRSLVTFDLLVHTWDLARATGQDVRLDPALVRVYHAHARTNEAMLRQSGVFGPARDSPPDADEQTHFLAFLGRPV